MLRQPSNAYKFRVLVSFWILDTPACPSLQQNTSFSLRAQLLLQFEMMFWGFSRRLSPVPNSAICTCTHKRWFADANIVLFCAWSCVCRGLGNPLFRHFIYLPRWQINFHTLVLSVQTWMQKHLFPTWLLPCLHIDLWPTLFVAASHSSNFWLSRYSPSLYFWPAALIVFIMLDIIPLITFSPWAAVSVVQRGTYSQCSWQCCCFSWKLGAATWDSTALLICLFFLFQNIVILVSQSYL